MVAVSSSNDNTQIVVPNTITNPKDALVWIGNTFGPAVVKLAREYVASINWADALEEGRNQLSDQLQQFYDRVMSEPDKERVRLAIEGAKANEGRLGNIDINEAARNTNSEVQISANGFANGGTGGTTGKSLYNLHRSTHE